MKQPTEQFYTGKNAVSPMQGYLCIPTPGNAGIAPGNYVITCNESGGNDDTSTEGVFVFTI